MKRFIIYIMAAAALTPAMARKSGGVEASRPVMHVAGGQLKVSVDFTLDSVELGTNRQLYISPVVEGPDGESAVMPALLVNGRNMHYAYERGSLRTREARSYTVAREVRRHNGKPQRVEYTASVPYARWMLSPGATLRLVTDSCGCGHQSGRNLGEPVPLGLNPAPRMRVAYVTPAVTELPVAIHEGRARVQFEVDRTELHTEPHVCRNGQRIDNRAQLRIIDDSVAYALSDPNVEIAGISICGYASPESPYLHNEELSTARSRALAEYLGARYNLPAGKSTYSSVPENWKEFRQMAAESKELTERQRADLLGLIDRPAYGPSDYDAKERELRTDPRFASLYRNTILPHWFPKLRCTEFAISTRLKPLSDEKLAEVIRTTPAMMSLNQMMRVARLYPEGSPEFNEIIEIARRHYPADETACLNSAAAAIQRGDMKEAARLLENAGESAEAENARGIVAADSGDFDKAAAHFRAAGNLPEAAKNLNMLDIEQ